MITIKKVKLVKGNILEVQYVDAGGNDITFKGRNFVHPDLKFRMSALVPFLADLTEQREAPRIDWLNLEGIETVEALKNLSVSGVTIVDDDIEKKVVLSGSRNLQSSKVLNLCAPLASMTDIEDYEHSLDLKDAVDALLFEASLYVTENKVAVEQRTFDFDNDPDNPFAEATPTADVPLESVKEPEPMTA